MSIRKLVARTLIASLALGAVVLGPSQARADNEIEFGFSPEPGDATYGFVPSNVPASEVVAIIVDRSGPLTSGLVLLTHGRKIEFSGVESHPFAITHAYEPQLIAFADK